MWKAASQETCHLLVQEKFIPGHESLIVPVLEKCLRQFLPENIFRISDSQQKDGFLRPAGDIPGSIHITYVS